MTNLSRKVIVPLLSALMLIGTGVLAESHTKTPFKIQDAEWQDRHGELLVAGHGQYRCTVEVFNAGNGKYLGSTIIPDKRWSFRIEEEDLDAVPCRVAAQQLEGEYCRYAYDEMDVQRAPDDCGPNLEQSFLWMD